MSTSGIPPRGPDPHKRTTSSNKPQRVQSSKTSEPRSKSGASPATGVPISNRNVSAFTSLRVTEQVLLGNHFAKLLVSNFDQNISSEALTLNKALQESKQPAAFYKANGTKLQSFAFKLIQGLQDPKCTPEKQTAILEFLEDLAAFETDYTRPITTKIVENLTRTLNDSKVDSNTKVHAFKLISTFYKDDSQVVTVRQKIIYLLRDLDIKKLHQSVHKAAHQAIQVVLDTQVTGLKKEDKKALDALKDMHNLQDAIPEPKAENVSDKEEEILYEEGSEGSVESLKSSISDIAESAEVSQKPESSQYPQPSVTYEFADISSGWLGWFRGSPSSTVGTATIKFADLEIQRVFNLNNPDPIEMNNFIDIDDILGRALEAKLIDQNEARSLVAQLTSIEIDRSAGGHPNAIGLLAENRISDALPRVAVILGIGNDE